MQNHSRSQEPQQLLPEEALKFWLEEYKSLSSDIQNRVALQHGLMNFQLLVVAALVALVAGFTKSGVALHLTTETEFCILTLPIVFAFFVWRHSNHDANIIFKASYIYRVIRPNVIALVGDEDILGFEKFLEQCRLEMRKQFGIQALLGGEYFFHLIFCAISLFIALWIFFIQGGEFLFARTLREFVIFGFQDTLVLLDILCFLGSVRLRVKVAKSYGSIVSDSKHIWC